MGRRRRVYTPEATTNAEQAIAGAWRFADGPQFDGPVRVYVDFHPAGQWVKVESVEWTSPLRGDVDNYCKTLLDGLQRAEVFKNDRSVVSLWADKCAGDWDPREMYGVGAETSDPSGR